MALRSLLLGSLLLTACSFRLGSATNGDTGHAQFEYGTCLFGCAVDQSMMVGTSEPIRVTASFIPPVSARSSDESVLRVGDGSRQCCPAQGACRTLTLDGACAQGETPSLSITVVAMGPGNAELVLDQDGAGAFDSVSLTVAKPKSLVVTCGAAGTVTLQKTNACALSWTARDANNHPLMASTGVTMTTSDPTIADFSTGLIGSKESSITAVQGLFGSEIVAHAAGQATISANAGDASSKLEVVVTP